MPRRDIPPSWVSFWRLKRVPLFIKRDFLKIFFVLKYRSLFSITTGEKGHELSPDEGINIAFQRWNGLPPTLQNPLG